MFSHDDGIIDQDANREDKGKQRHPVEGEAPAPNSVIARVTTTAEPTMIASRASPAPA